MGATSGWRLPSWRFRSCFWPDLPALRTSTCIRRKGKARSSWTATATNVIHGRSGRPDSIRAGRRLAASDTHTVANQPPPPQGPVVRGAARGAALGAVEGAITGDAGTGAAAGAAMGGLAGGIRRRNQRPQYQQQQVAAQAATNSQQSQRNACHRAIAACLTGRGYTVNYYSERSPLNEGRQTSKRNDWHFHEPGDDALD
jgi:hypothetical protein